MITLCRVRCAGVIFRVPSAEFICKLAQQILFAKSLCIVRCVPRVYLQSLLCRVCGAEFVVKSRCAEFFAEFKLKSYFPEFPL